MLREFFCVGAPSHLTWAWGGLLSIVLHGVFRAYMKYVLNEWYSEFYDLGGAASEVGSGDVAALDAGAARITGLLWKFAMICLPQVLVHPFFKLITNHWILSWRLALVKSYLTRWRTDGTKIENGAQRVHEDTQRFARGLQTCFVVVLDSVLTLLVFTPLLVRMGAEVQPSELPDAWLLLLSAAVSVAGIGGSVLFGWSLVRLEVENQKVEAELRKELVILEEEPRAMCTQVQATHATGPAPVDMEIDGTDPAVFMEVHVDECVRCPFTKFGKVLANLKTNYTRLYNRFAVFSLWLGSYEQAVAILPYALTAPLLFCTDPHRRISLGKVTQLSNAFSNVFSALNILSDNWVEVTDWLSVLRRLREWESHLEGKVATGTRTLIDPRRQRSVRGTEMQRS